MERRLSSSMSVLARNEVLTETTPAMAGVVGDLADHKGRHVPSGGRGDDRHLDPARKPRLGCVPNDADGSAAVGWRAAGRTFPTGIPDLSDYRFDAHGNRSPRDVGRGADPAALHGTMAGTRRPQGQPLGSERTRSDRPRNHGHYSGCDDRVQRRRHAAHPLPQLRYAKNPSASGAACVRAAADRRACSFAARARSFLLRGLRRRLPRHAARSRAANRPCKARDVGRYRRGCSFCRATLSAG